VIQISDSQASIESSAVTAQGQAVLSQSESESAITHMQSVQWRRTLHMPRHRLGHVFDGIFTI